MKEGKKEIKKESKKERKKERRKERKQERKKERKDMDPIRILASITFGSKRRADWTTDTADHQNCVFVFVFDLASFRSFLRVSCGFVFESFRFRLDFA